MPRKKQGPSTKSSTDSALEELIEAIPTGNGAERRHSSDGLDDEGEPSDFGRPEGTRILDLGTESDQLAFSPEGEPSAPSPRGGGGTCPRSGPDRCVSHL